jgi:hypothetical protein
MWTGNKFIVAVLLYPSLAWGFATSDGLSTANRDGINQKRAGPSYQGPGDIVTGAIGWWGLRAYSSTTAGTKAVRLRRDSDQAEQDFNTLASGSLDTASIATFKGSANLFVVDLYDQAGTNNAVQTTASSQPPFTLAPTPLIDTGTSYHAYYLTLVNPVTQSLPWTWNWFASRAFISGDPYASMIGNPSNPYSGYTSNANQALLTGTSNQTAAATDNVFHAIQAVYNGTSSDLNIDGTVNTVNPGTPSLSAVTFYICGGGFLNEYFDGKAMEWGFWPVVFAPAQSSNMSTNQHAFWGL